MEEATIWKRIFLYLISRTPRLRGCNERGQAIVEYVLILFLAFLFTRLVFFHEEFGMKAMMDRTMLRLGSFLEMNLKTGTKAGPGPTEKSLEPFAGTNSWRN